MRVCIFILGLSVILGASALSQTWEQTNGPSEAYYDRLAGTDDDSPGVYQSPQQDSNEKQLRNAGDSYYIGYIYIPLAYNEKYNQLDRGGGGYAEYFESTPVYVWPKNDVPFEVALESDAGSHVLSTTLDGPETLQIPVDSIFANTVYLLGTGTWLNNYYTDHDTLWCDNPDHLLFALKYADGAIDSIFPTMVSIGEQRWGDILYGPKYGWYGVASGGFEAPTYTKYYHFYEMHADSSRELIRIDLVDKTDDAAGDFGDYTLLAATAYVADYDGDSIPDGIDNCPAAYNPLQVDTDGDGEGDVCDTYFPVTSLDDTGTGSFRNAITQADNSGDVDTIAFAISGIIALQSELPSLTTGNTVMLGSTAPGGAGSVVLDGNNAGGASGLTIMSSDNQIEGLIIANFNDGIAINGTARRNVIGPDNTIFGSAGNGVSINGVDADSNLVIGNQISGNTLHGVYLTGAPHNRIGGYSADENNLIFNNQQSGIYIYGNADSNQVIGNRIGVHLASPDSGNRGDGVAIDFNCDGTVVDSNLIAGNGGDGIMVKVNGRLNTLTRNTIYNNGQLAIDLADDGVTANDAGDTDTGPNDLLNFPEIDSVMSQPDESYMIYGRAAADATVEFYAAHPAGDSSRPADPSGYGEAWEYTGQTTASPTGQFTYNDIISDHFTVLSATATDASGNTSEMSLNYTLYPKPLIVVAYVYYPTKSRGLPQNGVNIIVEDPTGAQFGRDSLNNPIDDIPGDQYYGEGPSEDTAIIPDPIQGEYNIYIIGESGSPTGTLYAAIIRTDGSQQCILVIDVETPMSGTADSLTCDYDEDGLYINGDANGDATCNVSDAVYVINYVFKGGPPPTPADAGDANCDQTLNVSDAVYIINYVFKGGPLPCQIE